MAKSVTDKRDKTRKGMTNPTPKVHRDFWQGTESRMDVNNAEATLIDQFRRIVNAQTSRTGYTHWLVWELLRMEVDAQEKGRMPDTFDVKDEPERHAAVTAIREYLRVMLAETKDGAKRQRKVTPE